MTAMMMKIAVYVALLLAYRRPRAVAFCAKASVRTSRISTTTLSTATPPFSQDEVLQLLSDDAYAMDISSITKGSELETYIGQGSGVNQGTGIGALSGFVQKVVGKYLTWKNQPICDKLWTIIEDDLLAMAQEKVPDLRQASTCFSPNTTTTHSFQTPDGTCQGSVAAYKGGNIDWITTCRFFSKQLGFGNMRIDGWTVRNGTRAPHMAVHLCIVFDVIFIYISLVPRANLLLDDEYNDYGTCELL